MPELEYITIHESEISTLASELASEEFQLPEWRAPVFPSTDTPGVTTTDVIDFFFLGNTLNFQFRDHDTGEKFTASYAGTEWPGAFGMWACLAREFEENPAILSGETLATLSLSDVERLFEPANEIELPMLEERHQILNQVGDRLCSKYDGHFLNLVARADPYLYANQNGIVERLVADFPTFQDSSIIQLDADRELEVIFWKRAQLAAGMAYGRFGGQDPFCVIDPEAFTVFADYNLPNVMRGHGLMEYSTDLANKVDSRAVIEKDSREEVEIRAAAVHIADMLIKQVNLVRRDPIYAPHLDYKLFKLRDNVETPTHLTRTTAY